MDENQIIETLDAHKKATEETIATIEKSADERVAKVETEFSTKLEEVNKSLEAEKEANAEIQKKQNEVIEGLQAAQKLAAPTVIRKSAEVEIHPETAATLGLLRKASDMVNSTNVSKTDDDSFIGSTVEKRLISSTNTAGGLYH